ncbi:uncharacterized protein [Amphiura filiformis]|uniref:uncharacterized protein n=1 Tax=Amphiura filiformis TaxID=82378 RepID=UPI003B214A04
MSRGYDRDCKVYVGDLPNNARKEELEDAFNRYGDLKSVWVARNPPGFAFIEFEDSRDAKDAVRELDGTRLCGGREVKVEIASGRRRGGGGGGGGGYGGGGGGGYGGGGGGYGRGPPRDRRNESCYACGERGHFARDCKHGRRPGDGEGQRGGSGGGGRYNSRRSRSRSRSRSNSPRRNYRDSRSRSRSPSPKN